MLQMVSARVVNYLLFFLMCVSFSERLIKSDVGGIKKETNVDGMWYADDIYIMYLPLSVLPQL